MDNSPSDDHVFLAKDLRVSLTWSAIARPSLSILDPASAIFFAALITSEVFLSGPLPLEKKKIAVSCTVTVLCAVPCDMIASMFEHEWYTSRSQHVWHENGCSYWQVWRKKKRKKKAALVSQSHAQEQHSMNKAFWERQDQFVSNWLISLRRNIPLQHASIH